MTDDAEPFPTLGVSGFYGVRMERGQTAPERLASPWLVRVRLDERRGVVIGRRGTPESAARYFDAAMLLLGRRPLNYDAGLIRALPGSGDVNRARKALARHGVETPP